MDKVVMEIRGVNYNEGLSSAPVMSGDGRFVLLKSLASNLVSGDTNGKYDVFVRDTKLNTTVRVNVSSTGAQDDGNYVWPNTISESGRYVAYQSSGTTLEGANTDPYGTPWMYVHDLKTGTNTYIPVPYGGSADYLHVESISNDGRFIVARGRVSVDAPLYGVSGQLRVIIYDSVNQEWSRLVSPVSGNEESSDQTMATASCDGSYVAFHSGNSNLVTTDGNGTVSDIFLVDFRKNKQIINLTQAFNGDSASPKLSCNGKYVIFESTATNIVNSPSNINGNNIYIYNRISGEFSLASKTTSGDLLYTPSSYSLSFKKYVTDKGEVIFPALTYSSEYWGNARYYLWSEKNQTTTSIIDHITSQQLRVGLNGSWNPGVNILGMDKDGSMFVTSSYRTDLITSDTNDRYDSFIAPLN